MKDTYYLLSVWLRRLYRPRETPSPTEIRRSNTAALRKREGLVVALATGAVVMCCGRDNKRLLLHTYKASPRYVSLAPHVAPLVWGSLRLAQLSM